MEFVFILGFLIDVGKDGLCWHALSGHWLSCTGCLPLLCVWYNKCLGFCFYFYPPPLEFWNLIKFRVSTKTLKNTLCIAIYTCKGLQFIKGKYIRFQHHTYIITCLNCFPSIRLLLQLNSDQLVMRCVAYIWSIFRDMPTIHLNTEPHTYLHIITFYWKFYAWHSASNTAPSKFHLPIMRGVLLLLDCIFMYKRDIYDPSINCTAERVIFVSSFLSRSIWY